MARTVVALFDGLSGGQLALQRAGISVERYLASEIDPYARAVAEHQFPNMCSLGDVTRWRDWDVDWSTVDLILAGSPCQGFSFAGKQLAFEDPRSKLYFEFEALLAHVRRYHPKVKFLLENVRMKQANLDTISERLGVTPVRIDSAILSAQTRVRYYWCNWSTTPPKPRNITLENIIQHDVGGWHTRPACQRGDLTGPEYLIWMIPRGNNPGGARALDGKVPCLTANAWQHNFHLTRGDGWARKLTPVEFERLQTVPDGYTALVSDNQRYRMLGNGWTVDVIADLLSQSSLS
jgi:site-specific DNA-cytosine methylase